MSPNSNSNLKFFTIATFVIIGTSTALASAWPLVAAGAKSESARLVQEGSAAPAAEATVDYQLAAWLDSGNQSAYLGLGRAQILAGTADSALKTLDRAGEGSEAGQLRIRTLMELGRTSEAAERATPMAVRGRSDADILLAGLAYALANRATDIPALIPLVGSPEASQRLARMQSGNLPLAAELYASGLPESSRALLVKLPTSFERNVLLARIGYDRHTVPELATATDYLTGAVALNPSDIGAHELLAAVYASRGLTAESAVQNALALNLQNGRP